MSEIAYERAVNRVGELVWAPISVHDQANAIYTEFARPRLLACQNGYRRWRTS